MNDVPRLYRCQTCGWFSTPEGGFTGLCPRCGGKIFEMTCTRCGHTWMPRTSVLTGGTLPRICPSCKSPYWDRARVREVKG